MAEQGTDPIEASAEEEVSMELEAPPMAMKRPREEEEEEEDPQKDHNDDVPCKKQKVEEEAVPSGSHQNGVEKSVEEDRLDSIEGDQQHEKDDGCPGNEGGGGEDEEEEKEFGVENHGGGDDGNANEELEDKEKTGPVKLGPKQFSTSKEMFDYFYKFLHNWPINLNVNKYEHMVLSDLLIQGHHESQKKIGLGIEAFQIRIHPTFDSRCYFLRRKDGSVDDFSYRKCVDRLLPLPENMKLSKNSNFDQKINKQSKQGRRDHGGGKGRGAHGGGRGRGRHGHGRGRGHSRN